MSDDDAVLELLRGGLGDWVMLHDVVWVSTRDSLTVETKAKTVRVLRRLYEEGLMVPGELGHTGFEDWPGSADDWMLRSQAQLERLDWKPMGEGLWLRLTEHGQRVAQEAAGS